MAAALPPDQRIAHLRSIRERMIERARTAPNAPIDERHPLARAIGLDKARAILSMEPTPLQARWAARRAIVAKRIAEGVPMRQIADELNVTPSRISQLRKALRL